MLKTIKSDIAQTELMQNYPQAELHRAIGEFITIYASIEQQLNVFLAITNDKANNSFSIAEYFDLGLTRKIKLIGNSIKEIKRAQLNGLDNDWERLKYDLEQINLDRHHIVHGSGFAGGLGGFFTFSDEYHTKTVTKRIYTEQRIHDLTQRLYRLRDYLFDEREGGFLNRFLKGHNPNYKTGSLVYSISPKKTPSNKLGSFKG